VRDEARDQVVVAGSKTGEDQLEVAARKGEQPRDL
jgi:hypothetical protein